MGKIDLPRGLRNNNPLNIRKSADNFQGENIPSGDSQFKQFKTMAYGYRAALKVVMSYYRLYGLRTIRRIVGRWAPENENNTEAYVLLVSSYSGVPADSPIDIHDREMMIRIIAGMSRVENGREADTSDILAGWNLL